MACWVPPGFTDITFLRLLRSKGLPVISYVRVYRFWTHVKKHEDSLAEVHKDILRGPHYYLWGIAVDPNCQGKGVGKLLMKPGLDQADAQNVPIYLETHHEKNVLYYQKLGFDLVRTETLPGYDLKYWCMVRSPR